MRAERASGAMMGVAVLNRRLNNRGLNAGRPKSVRATPAIKASPTGPSAVSLRQRRVPVDDGEKRARRAAPFSCPPIIDQHVGEWRRQPGPYGQPSPASTRPSERRRVQHLMNRSSFRSPWPAPDSTSPGCRRSTSPSSTPPGRRRAGCADQQPTGQPSGRHCRLPVTGLGVAMPLVLVDAWRLGRSGYKSPAELNADRGLADRRRVLRGPPGR